MHFVLLSNYNNYYNRIYKKLDTYQEYVAAADTNVQVLNKSVNFDLQDGIMIQHVFNCQFTGEPNYCLLLNETDNSIASRWFVIEWDKVRGNQYRAILRRDLLADHYDAITASPCFIEKGWVPNTDSAIFNKENMTFNQIKTSEQMLRDDSKTSWIVGYIAQDHAALVNKEFTVNPEVDLTISGNHTDWTYADLVDGSEQTTLNPYSSENNMRFVLDAPTNYKHEFMFNSSSHSEYSNLWLMDWWEVSHADLDAYRASNWYSTINWDTCMQHVLADHPSWTSRADYNYLCSLVGKKIQFSDGIYTINITQDSDILQSDWSYWNSGNLYNYLFGVVNSAMSGGITEVRRYPVAYKLLLKKFRFTLIPITDVAGTYKYSIPQTVRKLEDAPYKMFCIPYYKDVITTNSQFKFSLDGSTYTICEPDLMMSWALDIAKQFGDNLYDLKILPYCTLSNWSGRSGDTNAAVWSIDKQINVDYVYLIETIGGTDYSRGVCSFCDVSSKEQVLDKYSIIIGNPKLANECYTYRLCSPNYASVFEFSPAMNGGVEGYNVRYTYKPYQPFINVAPVFSRLYGKDFKDNRGLILAGDFSLPIIKDAWINYQLQNKNYQLAFDRQIENMEVQYQWQKAQGITNAISGTLQGATTGAMAGGMVGGPWGAVAGAAIGTVGSAVGGVMDVQMQQSLHNEAIDFAKDNFGYQLGNIKALPNTLNKVSSIVANTKFFPFVETYTCTNEERQAFLNKIKYNGMSIGRIGQILDFKNPSDQTYIKGQIIRLEGKFDTHTANEIANEFNKGWYI